MTDWTQHAADITLQRFIPRMEAIISDADDQAIFRTRLTAQLPRLIGHLYTIYGDQFDFFYYLMEVLETTAHYFRARPASLRDLDIQRVADPLWFKRNDAIGAVCYVDLFAENLDGIRAKIPYFKELNISYLHLMPLFRTLPGKSDGGYAISDFRQVNPALGTMDDLAELAAAFRQEGISLVLDFVFNHTADEHTWARKALEGDPFYQKFFYIFPDRTLPDQYEPSLREIFPDQAPGSFTYRPEIDSWVWTTFNSFQWDLNYSNPEVFNAMLGEMLFLANQGVEILRLDAVAFIWKQLGTPCENLPQVHDIIRALNALVRVAAPALLFKSEAIVHPDDVAAYVSWEESPISYNPTLMALLWESLATRDVKLLRHSMSKRFDLPPMSAWVNYVRVHDDIGWSFADEDAAEMGIHGFDHRQFLNKFYTGQFTGSFAAGLPFNYNPVTQDMRISGTCASLAGLEHALDKGDFLLIENALRRILLIHSVILSAGGLPLLYLGDEIATLNDYGFEHDPIKADDSRWVHRPRFDWERAARRADANTPQGRIFTGLVHLIRVRKSLATFSDDGSLAVTQFFDTGNTHVLGYIRNRAVMVLANFSEYPQTLRQDVVGAYWKIPDAVVDWTTGEPFVMDEAFTLDAYQFVWLMENSDALKVPSDE